MYSLSFISNLKSSSKSDSIVLLEAILMPSEKKKAKEINRRLRFAESREDPILRSTDVQLVVGEVISAIILT